MDARGPATAAGHRNDLARPEPAAQQPLAGPPAAFRQRAQEQMRAGLSLAETNHPVDARRALTAALAPGALGPADAEFVRDRLGALNRRLIFSPEIVADDPFSVDEIVQRLLERLAHIDAAPPSLEPDDPIYYLVPLAPRQRPDDVSRTIIEGKDGDFVQIGD